MATPREQAFFATPFASPSTRVIASPFQFATTEDDNLRIVSANSLTGVVLAIQGRRLTPKGDIEPFAFTHTPNTDRSVRSQDYKLGAGALLNVTIFAQTGAPRIGQTYVIASFIRGFTGATIVLGTLLAGYVTAAQQLAYPGSPIESSIATGGVTRILTGTDPAAGSDVIETVPTGARWRLNAIVGSLTADATVGNRRGVCKLQTPGGLGLRSYQASTIAASGATTWSWAIGMPLATAVSGISVDLVGLPDVRLLAGDTITLAGAVGAGDNWAAPTLYVDEWLEVAS